MKGKTKAKKLSVPNDLKEESRKSVIAELNPLVADAFALYLKTKSFHWHVTGPHFRDYHLLFDEQAEQIFAMIDTLAERARKMGGSTISSIGHVHRLTKVKDQDNVSLSAEAMIRELIEENKNYTQRMRSAHDVCADLGDCATTSILEVFIDESERRVWFLSSICL
jgi:starvation-inducible DNA-binding protein